MQPNPTDIIFSKDFLDHYHPNFLLSHVPNVNKKKVIIGKWIKELKSGKLDSLKEEEVKSRFVIDIFGRVLDYKFEHSKSWFLKEEAKTISSGKKSDCALGYFSADKSTDDVRVVIEIKDAKTALEDKQKRKISISAVEQAFDYGENMGDRCRWVVVSNFKEIRFYHRSNRTIYQKYNLEDLINEDILKEFILLFHKDRFISNLKDSQTDKLYTAASKPIIMKVKSLHILDQLYHLVSKFEGLGFVDPNYIASLFPFNVQKNYVWHYKNTTVFTLNNEIHLLLKEVSIDKEGISLSESLEQELRQQSVLDPTTKLKKVFKFLNKCLIYNITAVCDYKEIKEIQNYSFDRIFPVSDNQKIQLNISLATNETCDCLNCNYKNFEFGKLLGKLKSNAGSVEFFNSEYAYGNYMAASNDYKTSFNIYKHLENLKGKEGKGIEYFLARLNMKYLYNLIKNNYDGDDAENIIENIRYIDLDDVIYNELEYEIDDDVKKYLIQIKEDKLLGKVREEIRKNNTEIQDLRKLYENGGMQSGGTNIVKKLSQNYILLHEHVNKNFIIQNIFTDYQNISKELFSGLIESYKTKEVGLQKFNAFFIRDAVLHLGTGELKAILKDVEILKIESKNIKDLIELFSNFFISFYKESSYAFDVRQNDLLSKSSISYDLNNSLGRIFTNIFTILLKSDIKKDDFSILETPILSFLKTENILYHTNLEVLSRFLNVKGNYFKPEILLEILHTAIKKDEPSSHQYEGLVNNTCRAIKFYYPEVKIKDSTLIGKALANCSILSSGRSKIQDYIHLLKICGPEFEKTVQDFFDNYLDTHFNYDFYKDLLNYEIYHFSYKDYFEKYLAEMSQYGRTIELKGRESKVWNYTFSNFTFLIHALDISLSPNQISKFTNLNDIEKWLLDPHNFDYSLFQGFWLKHIIHSKKYITKIKIIPEIKTALEKELKEEFNQNLSNLYVQHFI